MAGKEEPVLDVVPSQEQTEQPSPAGEVTIINDPNLGEKNDDVIAEIARKIEEEGVTTVE